MKTTFLAFLAAGLLLLSGCEKEADLVEECTPATPHALASFWARNGVPIQSFTFNASKSANFLSAKGNRFYIQPNSFVWPDGSALPANAMVRMELREIETKAEMLLSNMTTVSNGQPLESAGEYYLRATADGKKLRMSRTGRVNITTADRSVATANSNMQLFFGRNTTQGVNWLPVAPQDTTNRVYISATTTLNYFIRVNNDSLGWINLDAFLNAPQRTSAYVEAMQSGATAANTATYLVFTSSNSIVNTFTYSSSPAGIVGTFSYIPAGTPVSALVIRYVAGQFYFGREDGVVSNQQRFAPALRAVSEAELVAELRRF